MVGALVGKLIVAFFARSASQHSDPVYEDKMLPQVTFNSVEYSSFGHILRATRIFLILELETVASRVDRCSARAQSDEHGEQKKELEDEGLL